MNNYDTLPMTPGEILSSYRQAKDPKKQVKILAQLNDAPVDLIIDILKSQGVDGRQFRYIDAPAKHKPKVTSVVDPHEKAINYISSLLAEKAELTNQLQEIQAKLDAIRNMIEQ